MRLTRRGFVRFSSGALLTSLFPAFGQSVGKPSPSSPAKSPAPGPFAAHFVDVAREAGLIEPVIYGEADHKDYILETMGCGCAFLDYDDDGWMDIFVLNGSRIHGAPEGTTNRLYRNNRDGTFTDVTRKAGLSASGWASAVCVGDYNNDGFEDIFCTYYGQNQLYRNNGDGTFTDVTKDAGLVNEHPRWGAGCTFVDYNRDGHLDLFVSNYVQFDIERVPKPGANANCTWKGIPVNCGPRGLTPCVHTLYRNNGDGTFTDVSREAGIVTARPTYGMTAVAADFNEDGWPDIYVACDSTPSLLFMNQGDGTFKEQGIARGAALTEDGREQAGMGVGVGDYNLDGHLDVFKTNFADDTNILYENDGKANFEDMTFPEKLGVQSRYMSWGAGIVDLDNDGWPDIFFVSGSVYPEIEKQLPNYPDKCPRTVLRNLAGAGFQQLVDEAGPGIAARHSSRGCAFGDFDNDGDVDMLVVNLNEPPSLLRNDLRGDHHWVKVKLIGTKSNHSAIGARVLLRYDGKVQAQSVLSQASFYSANDPRLHFGLGAARSCDLEIVWPSGTKETYPALASNQLVTIREGAGIVPSKGWDKQHALRGSLIPAMVLLVCSVLFACSAPRHPDSTPPAPASGTDYYLDCSAHREGKGTKTSPWNSMASVNAFTFLPGDHLLLSRNTACNGTLTPRGSGAPQAPIVIDTYGTGAPPVINGGNAEETLKLFNQQYWEINNLEIAGGHLYGVYISGDTPHTSINHIYLRNLNVHGATYTSTKRADSGEVFVSPNGAAQILNDVLVEGVTAHDSHVSEGIFVSAGGTWIEGDGVSQPLGSNVTVQNSIAHDIYGDGILISELNNGLLQRNVVYRSGLCPYCTGSTPVGLWEWYCHTCTVQYNESYANQSWGGDGGDFDIDYFSDHNVVQYNYGHDSAGYCVAFFGAGGRASHDNIFRYNVCSNNGRKSDLSKQGEVFVHTWDQGSLDGVQIYNNTFYWNPASNAPAFSTGDATYSGTDPRFFKNNIIYATVPDLMQTTSAFVLDNNIYWTTSPSPPTWQIDGASYTSFNTYQAAAKQDSHSYYADPRLSDPDYHAVGKPAAAFHLLPGSPATSAGANVCGGISQCSMGEHDFWGRALPSGTGYNIGAYQGP